MHTNTQPIPCPTPPPPILPPPPPAPHATPQAYRKLIVSRLVKLNHIADGSRRDGGQVPVFKHVRRDRPVGVVDKERVERRLGREPPHLCRRNASRSRCRRHPSAHHGGVRGVAKRHARVGVGDGYAAGESAEALHRRHGSVEAITKEAPVGLGRPVRQVEEDVDDQRRRQLHRQAAEGAADEEEVFEQQRPQLRAVGHGDHDGG